MCITSWNLKYFKYFTETYLSVSIYLFLLGFHNIKTLTCYSRNANSGMIQECKSLLEHGLFLPDPKHLALAAQSIHQLVQTVILESCRHDSAMCWTESISSFDTDDPMATRWYQASITANLT